MRDIQQIAAYLGSYNKNLLDPSEHPCMLMHDVQQTGAMLAKAVGDNDVKKVLSDIDYPKGSDGKRISFLKKGKSTELLKTDGKTPKAKRPRAYRAFFGTFDFPRKTSLLSKHGAACVLIELLSKDAKGHKHNTTYFSGVYKTLKPALLVYVNDCFEVQLDYVLRVTPSENSTFQMVCDELMHPVQIAPSEVMGADYVLSSFMGFPVCRGDLHFTEKENKIAKCSIPKEICKRLQNNPRDFFYMVYTLCNQIAHVHKTLGQPHYDVKPANVLLRIVNDRVEACLIDMPMPCSDDQVHFTPANSILRWDKNGPVLGKDGVPLLEKPGFLFHDYHGLLNVLKELIDSCNLTKKGPATVLYKALSAELCRYHNDVEWDVMRPGGPKCFLDWWYTPQRFAKKLRKWECEHHQLHPSFSQKPYPFPLDVRSYSVFEHHHVQYQKRLQKSLAAEFVHALVSKSGWRYRARGRHPFVRFFMWLWWVFVVRPMRWIKRMCGFASSARSKTRVAPAQIYKASKPVTSWSVFAKRERCYQAGGSVSSSVLSSKGIGDAPKPVFSGAKHADGDGTTTRVQLER